MHAVMTDVDTLRQVARGWAYAYGADWAREPGVWACCTCASLAHDDPHGCDLTCVVCEVVASVPSDLYLPA